VNAGSWVEWPGGHRRASSVVAMGSLGSERGIRFWRPNGFGELFLKPGSANVQSPPAPWNRDMVAKSEGRSVLRGLGAFLRHHRLRRIL